MTSEPTRPIFSFAVITDTHLTANETLLEGDDKATRKLARLYEDVITRVNAMNPAFVVHLGDMADPVPTSEDYAASAEMFQNLSSGISAPFHVVPGNHDIGEKIHKALPHIDERVSITEATIAQYERTYGPHYYSFEYECCLFVVLNALLLNAGFEEEQVQWNWLSQTLSEAPEKRIFLFTHYPMYLADRHEPDYYDNLEEPARTRLFDLLQKHKVEGYFSGHVHNFFYDFANGMHHTVLPSASILRSDYMEMFRSRPTREMGVFDPAKLGFLWVDVYADRHVPHFIRSSENLPYRTHSWKTSGTTVTADLRLPWCETTDVPCAWGLEIFERKEIRNDYPLAALWEMGITDLRIPISDLLKPHVSRRVKQLTALGHRFTVVSFGLPDDVRRAAIADHADGLKAIEIVAFLDQWKEFVPGLNVLRQSGDFNVFLNAVRPEVEGWTTRHGLHTDLTEEITWVMDQSDLKDVVDGFVFGIRQDTAPFDGYNMVRECLAGTGFKPNLHVPNVSMYWGINDHGVLSQQAELARIAETAFLARAHFEVSFVIDNFVELERGYCGCHGLVDRFYNPKAGSRILTGLNSLLPSHLENVSCCESPAGRLLSADSGSFSYFLVCDSSGSSSSALEAETVKDAGRTSQRACDAMTKKGRLIHLTNGEEEIVSLDETLEKRSSLDEPCFPMLLIVPKTAQG